MWKAEKPTCLKTFDRDLSLVNYHNQKKAWMDGDIMESMITKLSSGSCSILLLMDNASLRSKCSSIKVHSFQPT